MVVAMDPSTWRSHPMESAKHIPSQARLPPIRSLQSIRALPPVPNSPDSAWRTKISRPAVKLAKTGRIPSCSPATRRASRRRILGAGARRIRSLDLARRRRGIHRGRPRRPGDQRVEMTRRRLVCCASRPPTPSVSPPPASTATGPISA